MWSSDRSGPVVGRDDPTPASRRPSGGLRGLNEAPGRRVTGAESSCRARSSVAPCGAGSARARRDGWTPTVDGNPECVSSVQDGSARVGDRSLSLVASLPGVDQQLVAGAAGELERATVHGGPAPATHVHRHGGLQVPRPADVDELAGTVGTGPRHGGVEPPAAVDTFVQFFICLITTRAHEW